MRKIVTGFACVCFSYISLYAQVSNADNKLYVSQLVEYLDIANRVHTSTHDEWSALITKGEDKSLPVSERAEAWKQFYLALYAALELNDPALKSALDAGIYSNAAVTLKVDLQPQKKKLPGAQLTVEKRGSGREVLLMLTEFGLDKRIYEEFAALNKDKYTMYIVAFPGMNVLSSYQRPEKRTAELVWLKKFVTALSSFITEKKLVKFVVVSSGKSIIPVLYLAGEKKVDIKAIVAINGTLRNSPQLYQPPQFSKGITAWKEFYPKSMPFVELFHEVPPHNYRGSFETVYTADRKKVIPILDDLNNHTDNYAFHYFNNELTFADAGKEVEKLSIPILSLVSLADELHPQVVSTRSRAVQWQKLKAQYPGKKIYIEYMEQARDIPFFDHATEVAALLDRFLLNPQHFSNFTSSTHAISSSPRAAVSRTIGNTDILVSYGSPAARGRKIFGQLVPFGRVWRAGANESTTISFSRDVIVHGRLLRRGEYSLFVRPDSLQWRFIFNRIIHQWGAFTYDSTFNALDVSVAAVTVQHEEWLSYGFEDINEKSARLSLSWGDKKGSISLAEFFTPPLAHSGLRNADWRLLLEDVQNDGSSKTRPDGKQLYYWHDKSSDSLWFKFITYGELNMTAPAMTISIDTDADQSNGTPWYGSNQSFKVDLMIACGPVRQGDGYNGYNGLTDAEGIGASRWMNIREGNVRFYFAPSENAYIIGLPKKDLGLKSNKINLIGSVGASGSWNDDIGPDGKYATITF